MTELQKKIINYYEKTKEVKTVYKTYGQIASTLNCSKAMVHDTIQRYKRSTTGKI